MFRRSTGKPRVLTSNTGRSQRLHRTRLSCELLETRLAPASIAWDGGPAGTGTDWLTAANWVGDALPGASDDADIGAPFSAATITVGGNVTINKITSAARIQINSGTFTVAAASSSSKLTLAGGTLAGAGDVTVSSDLSWTSGIMGTGGGKVTLSGGATGSFTGTGIKHLRRTFDNSGTVTYSGSGFYFGQIFGDVGTFNNLAAGTFNSTAEGADIFSWTGGTYSFTNSGSFNVSGGGTTSLDIPFTTTGPVSVTGAALSLDEGGTGSGTFSVGALGVLNISSGSVFTLAAGAVTNGVGTYQVNGGTLTINTNVSMQNLTVNSTLNGTGTVTVTSTLLWTGGNMAGTGKTALAATGTGTITGSGNKWVSRTVENSGTITYDVSGANLYFGAFGGDIGTLDNLSGATFNASGDGEILVWNSGTYNFNNSGTFNRSGAGTTSIGVPFNNGNAVNVTAGTLELGGGGNDTGPYSLSAGTTLRFSGGTHTLSAAAPITGASSILEFVGISTTSSTTIGSAVTVSAINISGNNATATLNSNISVPTLTMSAGNLSGTGVLTVTISFSWSGGAMRGTGKTALAATGTGTISSAVNKWISRTLENSGTMTYNGSNLYFGVLAGDVGTLNNQSGATFNAVDDGDILVWNGGTYSINNAGTFNRSGAGTSGIAIPFNNSNAVNVTAGTLELNGGGTDTGPYGLSPATVLRFNGGTRTMSAAASITGASATVEFASAAAPSTTTMNGAVAVSTMHVNGVNATATLNTNNSVPTLNMTAGTLGGTGILTVTSALNWAGGAMTGTGKTTLAASGTGTISGTSNKWISRTVENAGTMTYSGSNQYFGVTAGSVGTLSNLAGATFDVAGDGDFTIWNGGTYNINNAGLFRKSAGVDATEFFVPFHLTGSVETLSGSIIVQAGGSVGSTFNLAFGALTHSGGTVTVLNGAAGVGTGVLIVAGGTVTVNTGESGSVNRFTLRRGTVNGGGTLIVTNSLSFSGGVQSGAGKTVVAAGATGTMSSASPKFLGRTLENNGTFTYNGSGFQFGIAGGAGVLNNLATGVLNLSGDGDIGVLGGGAHAVNNSGTINRLGAGTSSIASGITFSTSGAVNVTAGTFDTASAYTQSAGTTTLSTGTTLSSAIGININGGVLTGVGTIAGNLTNGGTVRPGGTGTAGTLTVTGNYTQTAAGVLNIELGGTGAGTFDVLAVGGVATLNGTLNVSLINGFNPANGDTFIVLTFASRSGTFATMTGLTLGGGLELDPVFNPNNLTLVTQPA